MKKLIVLFCLFFLWAQWAFGAAVCVDALWSGLFNNSGQPLSGGKVYTYTAGTTASATTWADSAKATPNSNPITLDAYGRASVYADGNYKFIVKDSDSVTIGTYDNLEYTSVVSPTTLSVTNLTVASGTINSLVSPHGILSDQTISSASINAATLITPTIKGPTISSFTVQMLASASIDALVTPATGLVVFNTSSNTLMIFNGSYWVGW